MWSNYLRLLEYDSIASSKDFIIKSIYFFSSFYWEAFSTLSLFIWISILLLYHLHPSKKSDCTLLPSPLARSGPHLAFNLEINKGNKILVNRNVNLLFYHFGKYKKHWKILKVNQLHTFPIKLILFWVYCSKKPQRFLRDPSKF